ncbi:MAG: endonuclease III [Thermodesulfobacteriota bacterium]
MSPVQKAQIVLTTLLKRYPDVQGMLHWNSPWQLLAATILAAQCTDRQVNKITPELFSRWPEPRQMAQANPAEVEQVIRPTGFYRNKTKSLIQSAARIQTVYQGQVPRSMSELLTLPGVARKTANIVLANAFGLQEGIAVDTHVGRIAYRLGLTQSRDPRRIEQDLMPLFPKEDWGRINHLLVWFGRDVCLARGPICQECELDHICSKQGVAKD